MNSNIQPERKRQWVRFAAIIGFGFAAAAFIYCFEIGYTLLSVETRLNSKVVEDEAQLARQLILYVMPALGLCLTYLSITLWTCSRNDYGQ